ncbi:Dr1-associated corepressor [Gracilariopsis chorda]|uniref:Dr1-associated corepressor n=1 Tax=Gracilariopsis chorda TaxID=448386 RepID=A0A2V3J2S5_9FLOR|nr:Dr1-associated corepressor [Gracilariopsis chorda]|eukprot:PXF47700.1 Dr1-associated corepressor [Gracilariopsis chorda]
MGRRKGTSAFPVARIKKMMQADEEVGKIATATPVLVAKALECMMEYVLHEAAQEARSRSTTTLTPQHLKLAVMRNDSFDFLRPLFSAVDLRTDDNHASPRPRRRRSQIAPPAHALNKRPRSPSSPSSPPSHLPKTPRSAPPPHYPETPPSSSNPSPTTHTNANSAHQKQHHQQQDDDEEEDYDEDDHNQPATPQSPSPPNNNSDNDNNPTRAADRVSVHALLS